MPFIPRGRPQSDIKPRDERNRAIQEKCILHKCLLRILLGLSRPMKRISFALRGFLSSRVRGIQPVFKDKVESDLGTLLFQIYNCVNIHACVYTCASQATKRSFQRSLRCFLSRFASFTKKSKAEKEIRNSSLLLLIIIGPCPVFCSFSWCWCPTFATTFWRPSRSPECLVSHFLRFLQAGYHLSCSHSYLRFTSWGIIHFSRTRIAQVRSRMPTLHVTPIRAESRNNDFAK